MFTEEELGVLGNFFDITENKEDVLLKLDSKNTKNQWILVDFTDKFEDRYGIYFKAANATAYKDFNQVKGITNVLNLIGNFETMGKNTTKVRNIKAYLMAALFNAGSTMGSYYKAEVNHDLPQFAG